MVSPHDIPHGILGRWLAGRQVIHLPTLPGIAGGEPGPLDYYRTFHTYSPPVGTQQFSCLVIQANEDKAGNLL